MQERIANVSKFISIKKELNLINDNQRKFVCNLFKESYDVLGINYKNFNQNCRFVKI